MKPWYYATGGQQNGPVSLEELVRLVGTGTVKATDLVWCEGMTGWTPAGEVPELAAPPSQRPSAPTPHAGPLNPYQAPSPASWEPPPEELSYAGEEIVPGSQPLIIGDCIGRAFELTKRHFWPFLGVCAVYFGITFGSSFLGGVFVGVVSDGLDSPDAAKVLEVVFNLAGHVLDAFLGLGLTRVGLNIVSGRPFATSMLFGEGNKLVTAVLAGILYYIMVAVGLVLLIVPGIYLALRFGQYQNAIVDKNLGVFDSLTYSARITEGNKLNLFGLGLVCFLIVLAGLLALVVGLCFAAPLVYLAGVVAYRWLIHGRAVLQDGYRA